MINQWKTRLIKVVQWGITIIAFWYIAYEVSWSETFHLLADINPWAMLIIFIITTLEFGARFSQWWILLNGIKKTPLPTTIRIDLVIKFINHVIPSKAAGHSIAPLVVKHYTDTKWRDAITLSGLNTGFYTTLYALVSLCGLVIFFPLLPWGPAVVIFLSSAMYAVVGGVVLFAGYQLGSASAVFNRIQRFVAGVPRIGSRLTELVGKLPSFTEESAVIFRDLGSRPSVIFPYIFAWVGTLAVFPGARVAVLLTELDGSFSILWLLPVVLVMAYSVTILPLTPGGIGIAEASATLVLVSLGVSQEVAIGVVLLDRLFGVYLPALLGAVPMANLDLATLVSGDR